ncbi:hypothetical protein PSAB_11705 [Paenibacillus sabinae T27]|uniref:Uncharacterized protein n=1 Tax=Paenibacillus sabinae T27 TaxID=1268072 RepID=X5A059_9BACL|nr:hypothetical protein PSAB_11705 [Paenibacillus sabinae T27]
MLEIDSEILLRTYPMNRIHSKAEGHKTPFLPIFKTAAGKSVIRLLILPAWKALLRLNGHGAGDSSGRERHSH